MKAKKKGVLAYVILWFSFLLYLFMSTKIVMLFVPESELLKTVSEDVYYSTQEPIFHFDVKPEYCAGLYEYVYISAWAFCETEHSNSNKSTGIVLRNVDNGESYVFETKPDKRLDVYDAYRATKKIYSDKVSLDSKFSTLNLPYGIYELFVRVVENQTDFGTVSTGMYFEKQVDNFVQVDIEGNPYRADGYIEAEEVELSLENYIDQGRYSIDSVKIENDAMYVSGWASYSSETNAQQKILIGVTGLNRQTIFYKTEQVNRPDVQEHFEDESYLTSGFRTCISLENPEGVYSLSVIAEIDGKYYPIVLNGKIFEHQIPEESIVEEQSKEDDVTYMYTDDVEILLSQNEERGNAYIDSFSFGENVVTIKGWASYSTETNAEQKVYVGLTDSAGTTKYYEAKCSSRSDVAKAKGDSYLNCGYSAEIRLLNIEKEYTVSIVIQVGEEFYPISIKNSNVIKR